jgi:hypothetical protein
MQAQQYIGTFILIGALILMIELILLGDSFSGSVVLTSACVAAGGTVGVAYRRQAQRKRKARE